MSNAVIKVENLSKQYRLGKVGKKTLHEDLNRWMHRIVGKEDPYLKIGEENDRSKKGNSDFVWALRNINFEIRQGEVLGIIGRNGAGKSTLLKILSKVTAPTIGNVKIKGRIASLLEVGTGFHPELSGRDNIFLNGAILGMTKKEIQGKLDAIIDFSGVERYIDTPVKRYSSGMYVRLAFAVAAHLEPDILIVDEVLAVGDAEFQKKCLGKMKDVSEQDGRTVLFVSHNMPTILKLCNNVLILKNGKDVFSGNAEAGIDCYMNEERIDKRKKISDRKDRKGNGFVRATDIEVLNKERDNVISVKSGDVLNLLISYTMQNPVVKQVAFRIQIVDVNEQIVFTCNNEHSGSLFPLLDKSGRALCTIHQLPLFGGTYYINVQFFSKENGLLDEVEFARELTVVDGDFFGSGKIPLIRKGVLVAHKWELINGE